MSLVLQLEPDPACEQRDDELVERDALGSGARDELCVKAGRHPHEHLSAGFHAADSSAYAIDSGDSTCDTTDMNSADTILLLDPNAQAGRTKHRLNVKQARTLRGFVRDALGNTKQDTPNVAEILTAAKALSALLYDATEGDAKLMVDLGGEHHSPAIVLSTLVQR